MAPFSPTTYLGAVPNTACRFNAVIYYVPSPRKSVPLTYGRVGIAVRR